VSRLRRRANRRLYRLLTVAYRTAFRTVHARRLRPDELHRVLIIRNDAVGDLVVTTPILSFLAEVAPRAQVDVLASRSNFSLLAADERVYECHVSPTTTRGWVSLLQSLRRRRYDAIYSLRYGRAMREGLLSSVVAGRSTQKISVFRPKRYHGLFTRLVRTPRRAAHMAERLLYVVAASLDLGSKGPDASLEHYPMRLAIGARSEALVEDFLTTHGVKDFVVVNFSAREPERDWPASHCARVIGELARRHEDLTFVLTAPASRSGDAAAIVEACSGRHVVVFPSSPDLQALAALIRRARLVITPDTAAVHIAAATGRPVLGLYLQQRTRLWLPYGVPYRLVYAEPGAPIASIAGPAIVDAFEELHAELTASESNR
jgi:ADP-heptose:LPS heptosyltransferase